jgi:hypothetical protein
MRILAALAFAGVGCLSPISSGTNGSSDAATHDGRIAGHDARAVDGGAATADGGFRCKNQVTSGNTNGHHNAGMDCMDSCHDHGFTLAGTLYTSAAGTAIVSGATLSAIDALGNEFDMVSQTDGNFYTSFAMTFPVTIYASECPTIQMMTAPIAQMADPGCNQAGCHASGATAGRVHLP